MDIEKYQEHEIVVSDRSTTEDVIQQVMLVQDVMKKVMKEGEHYGTIPGCGDKPALFKSGAEKLSCVFKLTPRFEIVKTDLGNFHREYSVVCSITNLSGVFLGEGVGSCSTMEGKYRFRKADRVCPSCHKETIIKGKEEYGGGWLCWIKKDGCGQKFSDGDSAIEDQEAGKIEHDNPPDYYNTCLKMAKKRAHVDATLTVTAASDMFTQDIEEDGFAKSSTPAPKPKQKPVDMPKETAKEDVESYSITGYVENVERKTGKKKNGQEWVKYGITVAGQTIGTFDVKFGAIAEGFMDNHTPVMLMWEPDGKFKKIILLQEIDNLPDDAEETPF